MPRLDQSRRGVYAPGPPEAPGGPFDVRALARHYVLLGIDERTVTVRRKADGAVGTLRYAQQPLRFSEFRPVPGTAPGAGRRGPRT